MSEQTRIELSSGFLNVDKPTTWTSADVVRCVKGLLKVKKVGHGGTLDPLASGVLPICFGKATRLASQLLGCDKTYRMQIQLGSLTTTGDADGEVTQSADYQHVTEQQVTSALDDLSDWIDQVPPMYSALKHKGKRLYQLAREGITVELKPRRVRVYEVRLESYAPPELVVNATVSSGFYARSYAVDLAAKLGTVAHLAGLVRVQAGKFDIKDAYTIDQIRAAHAAGNLQELLLRSDFVLEDTPRVTLSALETREFLRGAPEVKEQLAERFNAKTGLRIYNEQEQLIALMKYNDAHVKWELINLK